MAKTNYSKVEDALNQELFKMNIQHLFDLADEPLKKNVASNLTSSDQARANALSALQRELKQLHKQDKLLYKKLHLDKAQLQDYFKNPSKISPQEWEKIKQVKDKLLAFKRELKEKLPKVSDEELIATQRIKHVNKRFNINERWLPLDTHAEGFRKELGGGKSKKRR